MGEVSELETAEEALGFQPSEKAWWIRQDPGRKAVAVHTLSPSGPRPA